MIKYRAHCSNIDWQNAVSDGQVAGTVGRNIPLEAFRIEDLGVPNLGIQAFAHVQDIGWSEGNILNEDIGSTGLGKHIEAVKIGLIGEESNNYDIWYRLHCQNLGWMEWAKNGELSGTVGGNVQAEAIQIQLHRKDEGFSPMVDTDVPFMDLTPQNPPIPQAPSILDVARSHIGYISGTSLDSAFGRRLAGENAGDWCAYFVSCCAIDAGLNVTIDGYVPNIKIWAENNGRWTGDPQPGYYVLFDFGGGENGEPNGTPDHIGIVEQVISSDHVISIEGNTGDPVGVYEKDRDEYILGYVNPF